MRLTTMDIILLLALAILFFASIGAIVILSGV